MCPSFFIHYFTARFRDYCFWIGSTSLVFLVVWYTASFTYLNSLIRHYKHTDNVISKAIASVKFNCYATIFIFPGISTVFGDIAVKRILCFSILCLFCCSFRPFRQLGSCHFSLITSSVPPSILRSPRYAETPQDVNANVLFLTTHYANDYAVCYTHALHATVYLGPTNCIHDLYSSRTEVFELLV